MLTTRQKGLLLGTAVLIVLGLSPLLLYGVVRHTAWDRDYCLSCHNNLQGKEFWAQSTRHKPSVHCQYCHACGSGLVNTHFSKYTYLVSFNCRQCHWNAMVKNEAKRVKVTMPGGEKVYEWKLSDMYRWHVGKQTATCTNCHFNIAHDSTAEKSYQPIMEYCAGCHYHAKKDDYVRIDPLPRLVFVGGK